MKKVINFINRTIKQVYISYLNLKNRYKDVILHYHYYNGWWWGWFVVEGRNRRKLA